MSIKILTFSSAALMLLACGDPSKTPVDSAVNLTPEDSHSARQLLRNSLDPTCAGEGTCNPTTDKAVNCIIANADGEDIQRLAGADMDATQSSAQMAVKNLMGKASSQDCILQGADPDSPSAKALKYALEQG